MVAAREAAARAWAMLSADVLRVVRQAADEHALRGEVHRPQLDVRLQEEAVGVQRHLQQLRELRGCPRSARCRR